MKRDWEKAEGRGGLPPDREASSTLRGSSTVPEHMPSTGRTNETKTKKGSLHEEKKSESGGNVAPSKPPSGRAEKHPSYDRMNADNKKAIDKKAINEVQ